MLAKRDLRGVVSSITTVVIGVFMLTFSLVLGDSVGAGMQSSARAIIGDTDVVVAAKQPAKQLIDDAVVSAIEGLGDDVHVRRISQAVGRLPDVKSESTVFVSNIPELSADTVLVSGRLPQHEGEVAVNQTLARNQGYSPGSVMGLLDGNWQPAGDMSVVGVIAPGNDTALNTRQPAVYAFDSEIARINGKPGYSKLYISSDRPDIREQVVAALEPNQAAVVVSSAESEVINLTRSSTMGADLIIAVMAALGVMCVLVSAIVVTSVFHTFATRRRREFALLRCIGASKSTVFSIVMKEGLVVGLIGSVLGILLGLGVSRMFATWQGDFLGSAVEFSASVSSLVIAGLVGVMSTLVASLRPAKVANSVPPVLMANKHAFVPRRRYSSVIRAAMAVVCLCLGVGLLMVAVQFKSLLPAIPGGVFAAVAVMLGLQPLIVLVGSGLSKIAETSGSTAFSVAVGNILRNVRRSANSALALAVGAALAGIATVGIASVNATTMDFSDREQPVDAIIEGEITDNVVTEFLAIPGVEAAQAISSAEVVVQTPGRPDLPIEVLGVDEQDQALLRSNTFGGAVDSDILVLGALYQVPQNEQVTVISENSQLPMTTRVGEPRVAGAVTSRDNLNQLSANPVTKKLWLRFTGEGLDRATKDQVTELAVAKGLKTQGEVAPRLAAAELFQTYSIIVFSVIVLALIVALIGVATATELSLFERRDELKLFRCLGATKKMLMASIGIETLCVAAIGSLVGLILGAALGAVGASTVLATDEAPPIVDFDFLRLLLVFLGCLVFGTLSSVLSGYKAIRGQTVSA